MPKLFKKLTLSLLSSLIVLFSFAPYFTVRAAPANPPPSSPSTPTSTASTTGTWYSQNFQDWYAKVSDSNNPSEIFGERYTSAQVEWVIYGVFAFFINHIAPPGTAAPCIKGDIVDCTKGIQEFFGSLNTSSRKTETQDLGSLIFSDRPFSGISYIRHGFENLSTIPVARAQTVGFGFGALNPILALWQAMRNFAFGLSVIAAIALAFMIMFRVKISPQVVITAQSAVPKVILALIFVTFSYAIGGFLVDLMYVVIGILSLFFSQFIHGGANHIFVLMTDGSPIIRGGILPLLAFYFVTFYAGAFFTAASYLAAVGSTPFLAGSPIGGALAAIIVLLFILAIVVTAVVLLFMIFKILWLLLKTTAQILLLVIFGPILIMLGVIASNSPSLGMGSWVRSLVVNLAVYPIVGSLFLLSFVFNSFALNSALKNLGAGFLANIYNNILGISVPAVTGGWNPPLTFGADQIALVFLGVSFAIITLIPKTAEIIQSALSGKPFGFGNAIGEALGPISAPSGFVGSIAKDIGRTYATQRLFGQIPLGKGTKERLDAQNRETAASNAPPRRS